MDEIYGEEEVKGQQMLPFMMDDVAENNLCQNCNIQDECAILHAVNKMALKRDGVKVNDIFGCTPFFQEIEV